MSPDFRYRARARARLIGSRGFSVEDRGASLFVVAAAGIVPFKDKVGRYGITGIVLGVVSLIMLSAA